jgi:hypothetical protein
MNSAYSPFVIRRDASWNGSMNTRWRGCSLSKAKAPPAEPIQDTPSGNPIQRKGAGAPAVGSGPAA